MLDNLLLKLGFKGHDGKARPGNLDASGNLKVKVEDTDPVKVQVSGYIFGADLSDRPPADSVPVGTTFTLANTDLDTWITNGVDWVEV
jgi:hypothetical protein